MSNKSQDVLTLSEGILAKSEQNKLVTDSIEWAKSVVNAMARRLPTHIPKKDLYSAAGLGLVVAAGKYDPDKGVKFHTFAEPFVRGHISDELRGLDPYSRGMRKDKNDYEKVYNKLSQELGREPDDAEMASELGMDAEEYHAFIDQIHSESPPSPEKEPEPDVFNLFDTGVSRERLIKAINSLPDDEKKVASLLYTGHDSKEIADTMGRSEGRISQIRKEAMNHLRKKLGVKEVPEEESLTLAGRILMLTSLGE